MKKFEIKNVRLIGLRIEIMTYYGHLEKCVEMDKRVKNLLKEKEIKFERTNDKRIISYVVNCGGLADDLAPELINIKKSINLSDVNIFKDVEYEIIKSKYINVECDNEGNREYDDCGNGHRII